METRGEQVERFERASSRAGSMLGGKFRLLRLIGVGGTAAVYEAQHRNGKRVALKVLHASLDSSLRQRERFLREAYVANTVGHPGVVQIFDDGVDTSGAVYLVMELLEGATLAELQKGAGGKLDLGLAIDAGLQVLDVLAVAHGCGVVHRDIKPANLFVTRTGQIKVVDFGIARVFEPEAGSRVETQSGSMLGTPAFMPQEQARGRWDEVEARSDLWALGATLFTLVSGEHVHSGETPNEQLGRAMTMQARSLGSLTEGLPARFVEVVDRALRFERDERWPDARSMQAALRAASNGALERSEPSHIQVSLSAQSAAGTTLSGPPVLAVEHDERRGPRLASLALIALLATGALISFKLMQRGSEQPVRDKLAATSQLVPQRAAPSSEPPTMIVPIAAPMMELPPPPLLETEVLITTPARPRALRPVVRRAREPALTPPAVKAAVGVDPLDLRY